MSGGSVNATKCARYLRSIGVEVDEAAWAEQERDHRAEKRAHNRELKKSCGHFQTHWTAVYHANGLTDVRCCNACGRAVEYRGAQFTEAK